MGAIGKSGVVSESSLRVCRSVNSSSGVSGCDCGLVWAGVCGNRGVCLWEDVCLPMLIVCLYTNIVVHVSGSDGAQVYTRVCKCVYIDVCIVILASQ